jgi:hypothetical protein
VVVLRFDAPQSLDTGLPFWLALKHISSRKRTLVRALV